MEQDESAHLNKHSFGYQKEGEEKQIQPNTSTTTTTTTMQNSKAMDLINLEKEIKKKIKQLLLLKKKISMFQNEDLDVNSK